MSARTITVGRKNSSVTNDIYVSRREDSVGRRHLEITIHDDGTYTLLDLNTANGTFIERGGQWERIEQATVEASARVRLGEYATTVRDLVALLPRRNVRETAQREHKPSPPTPARPRRNPATGEVEIS